MAGGPVRVFVSHHHSSDEDKFTARLVADMEAAGADVWVDTSGIPSDDFVKKISEGLAGRQWLVLVMTPDALKSQWVQREVNVALNEHTARRMLGVVPVVMKSCREQDIPLLWRTLQRYDATRDYQGAVSGLLRALGLTPPVPPSKAALGSSTLLQSSIPADRFPPRLASLGYQAKVINGVEVIIPPLCNVPAGEFLMGSDPSRDKNAEKWEMPQTSLNLPSFQIAKFPVTVAEYACFVRSGHAEPASQNTGLTWKHQVEGRLDHPVVNISWYDAVAYADWLRQQTGEPWRLPTEAEWEKAARGTDGRIYPWGNIFDQTRANTVEGGKGTTTPVDSYPSGVSPYGAQDMAGNVWDWTSTIWGRYPYTPTTHRENVNSTADRVLRGGGWSGYLSRAARTAFRALNLSVAAGDDYGFRLARSVPS